MGVLRTPHILTVDLLTRHGGPTTSQKTMAPAGTIQPQCFFDYSVLRMDVAV